MFRNAALSHSENTPTERPEGSIICGVSPSVASQLLNPVMPILLGYMAVIAVWTAVPETSIDEHGDPHLGEDEVGAALKRVMPTPTSNVVCLQVVDEGLLSRAIVCRPNPAHHKRSLPFGENVHLYLLVPRDLSMRRTSAAGSSDNLFHFSTL